MRAAAESAYLALPLMLIAGGAWAWLSLLCPPAWRWARRAWRARQQRLLCPWHFVPGSANVPPPARALARAYRERSSA